LDVASLRAHEWTQAALAIQQSSNSAIQERIAQSFRVNLAPYGTLHIADAMIGERNEKLQPAHYACCLLRIRPDA
jgi:hypothetical protein